MKHLLPVEEHIRDIVATLQEAGFESYIVGGAIRDLLLGRRPKDYDLTTAATPEEVRNVFGRRSVRIIGKRFRLAHLHLRKEIVEISTFRRAPDQNKGNKSREALPENMILSDNDYGTAEEDAWRRDFTINALFFDPVRSELLDFTGKGREDIENGIVRAIGNPVLRFEEDPVRMLRALKLVGQYDFTLDAETENALFTSLPLIRHAASSRLSLELEKVLSSAYGDRHLHAFHDFGFLRYFLPELDAKWNAPEGRYALELLTERNYRIDEGLYRNSISLALATLVLPFVEATAESPRGGLWPLKHSSPRIDAVLDTLFLPQNMMHCMTDSAKRILMLQPRMRAMNGDDVEAILGERSYSHARELMIIQNAIAWQDEALDRFWPEASRSGGSSEPVEKRRKRRRSRRAPSGKSGA